MYFTTQATAKPVLPFYQTVLCLSCVLVLAINGVSLFRNLAALQSANEVQTRAARVAGKVQYLNVLVMDAQSSLRGYFLSGSDTYLGPMRTAASEIGPHFAELKAMLADNPAQQKNLVQLHTLVERKLDAMNEALDLYRHGGLRAIAKVAAVADDKSAMDEIRLLVMIMAREQNEQLAARSADFYKQYQDAVMLGIGINLVAMLVIVLFYRLIRRSFFARVATQSALQSSNDNLETMVLVRTEQLSVLSHHLINVREEEKARLARELHDEMGANLTAINIDLAAVAGRLKRGQPELASMLERARATLVDSMELKRRLVENLRPSLLDNLGLSAALLSYCEQFRRVTGIDCEALVESAADEAGPTQSIAVFRIVQEALNNIAKHAQARHVIVNLAREADGLSLEVSDDGVGFEPGAAAKPKSHGLLGMRERALLLGGTLQVKRGVNDIGTCVEAFIPLSGVAAGEAAAAPAAAISAPRPSTGDRIPS